MSITPDHYIATFSIHIIILLPLSSTSVKICIKHSKQSIVEHQKSSNYFKRKVNLKITCKKFAVALIQGGLAQFARIKENKEIKEPAVLYRLRAVSSVLRLINAIILQ